MNNVYLVGMMGSGKSVTGKKLAEYLGYPFVDLDEWIQQKTKRTIADIFEKEGEAHFRQVETSALADVCRFRPVIVATGGGTILKSENVDRMKSSGKIIYLDTSVEFLWDRLKYKKDRPLLKDTNPREKLLRIYADRLPIYQRISDLQVRTDGETADTVARKIISAIGSQ